MCCLDDHLRHMRPGISLPYFTLSLVILVTLVASLPVDWAVL
jgi:hypothetical protein